MRTIAELLAGQGFEIPPRPVQLKQAAKVQTLPEAVDATLWTASTVVDTDAELDELADDEEL